MRELLNCGYTEVAAVLANDPAWHEARRKGIGGSDARIIMEGDPAALIQLWQEKRGDGVPADLSDVVPVVLGTFTEPANRYFYTKRTGRSISSAGEMRTCASYPFMRCTLDGLTTTKDGKPAVFQAKHVNAFSKIEEVAQKYMAQVHHEMHVCGVHHAILSVFIGTLTYEHVEIECDDFYLAQLIDREREFWRCVEMGEPPVQTAPVPAPSLPVKWRTVDMTGNNKFASLAADWIATKDHFDIHKDTIPLLACMLPDDANLAFGYGVQLKRTKRNVTVARHKAAKEAA